MLCASARPRSIVVVLLFGLAAARAPAQSPAAERPTLF
jgi:hypothetical protein